MTRLAGRVREVVAALDKASHVSVMLRGIHVSQDRATVEATRTLVEILGRSWRAHLKRQFPAEMANTLRDLIANEHPDFLTLIGKQYDENAHSDVLRFLLDPTRAPRVAPAVLFGLTAMLAEPAEWQLRLERSLRDRAISVRREVKLGRESHDPEAADRIDLVISGYDFVIGIENKVGTFEHDEQTRTYWSWLDRLPRSMWRACFFLTPEGIPAACEHVQPLSYLALVGLLLGGASQGGLQHEERAVLSGYLKTLSSAVLKRQLWGIGKELPT